MVLYLKNLWKRRDLIMYMVTSGLKAQHRNTFLGYFWWLLDPLLGIAIYYFVVVIIFRRGGESYGIYLVVGMIVWRWLNTSVSTSEKSIHSQSGIITKVNLPKLIFPLGALITQLINFGFGLIVIALFFLFFRLSPGIKIIWLPYIITMQFFFMIVIGFSIAYIGVFFRDIDNVISHLLRLWFFGSPVIWTEEMIPERGKWLLELNPMTHFLRGYRNVLMFNESPNFEIISYIGFISFIIIFIIIFFYSKNEHRIIKAI